MTSEPVVWSGFTQAALDAAYNNSAAVSASAETMAQLAAMSATMRAEHARALDLAYGQHARQRFDLFACGKSGAPLLIFFHGGYWLRNSKDMFAALAQGPLALGYDVAMVGYRLAPEASLREIVAECAGAVQEIQRSSPAHGLAAKTIVAGGWSAGAHLAACMLELPQVAGALAISGIFDLEPLRYAYLQETLRLSADEARSESPIHRLARAGKPISIIVGGGELPELRRQSRDYAARRAAAGLPTLFAELDGIDHFSILARLRQPGADLKTWLDFVS